MLHFYSFKVRAKPGTEKAEKFGGAMANCWINFIAEDGARKLAEWSIDEVGWEIVDLERQNEIDPADVPESHDDHEYVDQAVTDGWCFVFYTWPLGEVEE